MALALQAKCCNCPPTPTHPPIDPVLYAVLLPGSPPTFARANKGGAAFEVLPSASVLLRFTNLLPDDMNISLKYPSGNTSGRLQWVAMDNFSQRQALDATGYYMHALDGFGYTVIVVPPAAQRSGPGFDIITKNISNNPPPGGGSESAPLTVTIVPKASRTKSSDVFFDCGQDHDSFEGKYYYNCKPHASVIIDNFTLEGWLDVTSSDSPSYPNCLGGLCWEDWHYHFVPNPDFIDAFYGSKGMFASLAEWNALPGMQLPGNPAQPATGRLPLSDRSADGSNMGITLNSFALPGAEAGPDGMTIGPELNAWHINNQGGLFSRHWAGRGPAPAGWWTPSISPNDPEFAAWMNTRWPFDPANPDGGATPLAQGDYVRVNGSLYQDLEHGEGAGGTAWETAMPGQAGWIEIHPVDWIERRPQQARTKTAIMVQFIPIPGAPAQEFRDFAPTQPQQPGEVLACHELIDGRFTNMNAVSRSISMTSSKVHVGLQTTGANARFKAIYFVWWAKGSTQPPTCSTGP